MVGNKGWLVGFPLLKFNAWKSACISNLTVWVKVVRHLGQCYKCLILHAQKISFQTLLVFYDGNSEDVALWPLWRESSLLVERMGHNLLRSSQNFSKFVCTAWVLSLIVGKDVRIGDRCVMKDLFLPIPAIWVDSSKFTCAMHSHFLVCVHI